MFHCPSYNALSSASLLVAIQKLLSVMKDVKITLRIRTENDISSSILPRAVGIDIGPTEITNDMLSSLKPQTMIGYLTSKYHYTPESLLTSIALSRGNFGTVIGFLEPSFDSPTKLISAANRFWTDATLSQDTPFIAFASTFLYDLEAFTNGGWEKVEFFSKRKFLSPLPALCASLENNAQKPIMVNWDMVEQSAKSLM